MTTAPLASEIQKAITYQPSTDDYACEIILADQRIGLGHAATYGAAEGLCAAYAAALLCANTPERVADRAAAPAGAGLAFTQAAQLAPLAWRAPDDPIRCERDEFLKGTAYQCGSVELYASDDAREPPLLIAFSCDGIELADLERDLPAVLALLRDPRVQALSARRG